MNNGTPNIPSSTLLLTSRQAAEALGVSSRTLWTITRPRGELPAVRIKRCVRYDVRDLIRLIEKQKETST